jgi:hypothetical protein
MARGEVGLGADGGNPCTPNEDGTDGTGADATTREGGAAVAATLAVRTAAAGSGEACTGGTKASATKAAGGGRASDGGSPVGTAGIVAGKGALGSAGEERLACGGETGLRAGGSPTAEEGACGATGAGVRGVTRPMAGVGVPMGRGAVFWMGASNGGFGAARGTGATTDVHSSRGGAEAGREDAVGNGLGLLRDGGNGCGSPGARGAAGGMGLGLGGGDGRAGFWAADEGRPGGGAEGVCGRPVVKAGFATTGTRLYWGSVCSKALGRRPGGRGRGRPGVGGGVANSGSNGARGAGGVSSSTGGGPSSTSRERRGSVGVPPAGVGVRTAGARGGATFCPGSGFPKPLPCAGRGGNCGAGRAGAGLPTPTGRAKLSLKGDGPGAAVRGGGRPVEAGGKEGLGGCALGGSRVLAA